MANDNRIVDNKVYRSKYAKPIANLLKEYGELSQGQMAELLHISVTTLSNALKKLPELVEYRTYGKYHLYSLRKNAPEHIDDTNLAFSLLLESALRKSNSIDAQFILANLSKILESMGLLEILLLLYFQGIIEIDNAKLLSITKAYNLSLENLAKNILGKYYDLYRATKEVETMGMIRERIK